MRARTAELVRTMTRGAGMLLVSIWRKLGNVRDKCVGEVSLLSVALVKSDSDGLDDGKSRLRFLAEDPGDLCAQDHVSSICRR